MIERRADALEILWIWQQPPPIHLYGFRQALKKAWKAKFGCNCPSCNREMNFKNSHAKNFATIDHIIARGLGGTDELHNIQVICRRCNNDKSRDEGRKAHYDSRTT